MATTSAAINLTVNHPAIKPPAAKYSEPRGQAGYCVSLGEYGEPTCRLENQQSALWGIDFAQFESRRLMVIDWFL